MGHDQLRAAVICSLAGLGQASTGSYAGWFGPSTYQIGAFSEHLSWGKSPDA
jgi:hypothetical protein